MTFDILMKCIKFCTSREEDSQCGPDCPAWIMDNCYCHFARKLDKDIADVLIFSFGQLQEKNSILTADKQKLQELVDSLEETIKRMENEIEQLQVKIVQLRERVWGMDIPHPTVPEYVELHEKMTTILNFIDNELLREAQG